MTKFWCHLIGSTRSVPDTCTQISVLLMYRKRSCSCDLDHEVSHFESCPFAPSASHCGCSLVCWLALESSPRDKRFSPSPVACSLEFIWTPMLSASDGQEVWVCCHLCRHSSRQQLYLYANVSQEGSAEGGFWWLFFSVWHRPKFGERTLSYIIN